MGKQETGRKGEVMAAEFLESAGYVILERNYRFQRAEVDLVCFQPADTPAAGGELVFVEVKTRTTDSFGLPESAVGPEKQKNLVRAARSYLYEHKLEGAAIRFDVVAVRMRGDRPEVEHFKAAFVT